MTLYPELLGINKHDAMQTQKKININPLLYNRETKHMVMLGRGTSAKTHKDCANIRLAVYVVQMTTKLYIYSQKAKIYENPCNSCLTHR